MQLNAAIPMIFFVMTEIQSFLFVEYECSVLNAEPGEQGASSRIHIQLPLQANWAGSSSARSLDKGARANQFKYQFSCLRAVKLFTNSINDATEKYL